MIFVGDIAIPHAHAIECVEFPAALYQKNWFGNLEGAIVSDDDNSQHAVYNNSTAITDLLEQFKFKAFALANNHILDAGTLSDTESFLEQHKVEYAGAGKDFTTASQEIVMHENGVEIVIVNFGWEVIQCEITTGNIPGVNPLRKDHVMQTVKGLVEKYPDSKVIPFMHWSYELEAEPQPFERRLAKELIEMGAAGVMGCHPHRIGGFEIYQGKPIVYSLGNWMFHQEHYHNGKLKFPDFCNKELAFEWDFSTDKFQCHFFEYDKKDNSLSYRETSSDVIESMKEYTPFAGLSDSEYKLWYKENHYHKRKGLPIYYWEDSNLLVYTKNKINLMRDILLAQLIKLRK